MRTTRAFLLPVIVSLGLSPLLLACGGGGDGSGTEDVASLGGATDTTQGDGDDPGGGGPGGRSGDNVAFEDAALEFAQCMREHGVDMPDPDFTGDGGVISMGPAGGERPTAADLEEMEAAQEACQPIMEEARSDLPPMDPAELEEMRANALEFAECMREHGIDFPDPVFDDDEGGIAIAIGGDDGDGGPSFDFEDEDFQAASEACGGEGGFMVGGRTASAGSVGEDG